MDSAITVQGLGKRYILNHRSPSGYYGYSTLRESMGRGLGRLFKGGETEEEFWALRGLDFEVPRGQRVGIIGRNGAGKSTLLKLLSRITDPSEGRLSLEGRVASLLEVGTGFHPELTGRENIFLNGAILGMRRAEVRAKFDAIVAFSESERFLDTPVKRYSSGMYMRLAFAVAAHLDPDILIVDEVLAVGDAAFQRKCLAKMEDVNAAGRTIIFVSHHLGAVQRLCERCLVLDSGSLILDSTDVGAAIKAYLGGNGNAPSAQWSGEGKGHPSFAPRRLALCLADGEPLRGAVPVNVELRVELDADIAEPDSSLVAGIAVFDEGGELLFVSHFNDGPETAWPKVQAGRLRLVCVLPAGLFNEGNYRVEMVAGLHYRENILEPGSSPVAVWMRRAGGLSESPYWITRRPGILAPTLSWTER
ncbi:MAG: ABC transporter ATP-binding protein [bacterium]